MSKLVAKIGQRGAHHFLVQLGKLAAHRRLTQGKRLGHRLERRCHAIGALIEDERSIESAQRVERRLTLDILAREEATEVEAGTRAAACHVCRGTGGCAGEHLDRRASFTSCANKPKPWIGHARHASVAAVRDHLAGKHAFYNRGCTIADERLVQTLEPFLDAEGGKQLSRNARVFRTHDVRFPKRRNRALGHVA